MLVGQFRTSNALINFFMLFRTDTLVLNATSAIGNNFLFCNKRYNIDQFIRHEKGS
uniref:Uncharacterized protein n=1 Tax=Arundo donax TaxID=35708 RepID=A0A0A9CLQ3_ARUDO